MSPVARQYFGSLKVVTMHLSNPETPHVEKCIPLWITEYSAGKKATAIARDYGVHPATVYRRLKEHGVKIRSKSEVKKGPLNPQWSFENPSNSAVHQWIKSRLDKPDSCPSCMRTVKLDLANISPSYNPDTYTRDLGNWRWLCRRCHMRSDNRLKNLWRGGSMRQHKSCTVCGRPHEAKGYCTKHYQQLRAKGEVRK